MVIQTPQLGRLLRLLVRLGRNSGVWGVECRVWGVGSPELLPLCSLFPIPYSLLPTPVLMQSLMGETTAVAHGGDPQDRAASPRPRCIATPYSLLPTPT